MEATIISVILSIVVALGVALVVSYLNKEDNSVVVKTPSVPSEHLGSTEAERLANDVNSLSKKLKECTEKAVADTRTLTSLVGSLVDESLNLKNNAEINLENTNVDDVVSYLQAQQYLQQTTELYNSSNMLYVKITGTSRDTNLTTSVETADQDAGVVVVLSQPPVYMSGSVATTELSKAILEFEKITDVKNINNIIGTGHSGIPLSSFTTIIQTFYGVNTTVGTVPGQNPDIPPSTYTITSSNILDQLKIIDDLVIGVTRTIPLSGIQYNSPPDTAITFDENNTNDLDWYYTLITRNLLDLSAKGPNGLFTSTHFFDYNIFMIFLLEWAVYVGYVKQKSTIYPTGTLATYLSPILKTSIKTIQDIINYIKTTYPTLNSYVLINGTGQQSLYSALFSTEKDFTIGYGPLTQNLYKCRLMTYILDFHYKVNVLGTTPPITTSDKQIFNDNVIPLLLSNVNNLPDYIYSNGIPYQV